MMKTDLRGAWGANRSVGHRDVVGHIERTRWSQVNRLAQLTVTFLLAVASAAVVAYSLAHIAHYDLGVPGTALRQQALICAALIFGLVTIEFLVSRE